MDRSADWAAYGARLAFFTLAYLATAMASVFIQSGHEGITPIWPPAGIALFAFYRYGLRMWPVVALGVGILDWQIGVPPLSASMAILGNISEAWLGCVLIRRFDIRIGQRFQDVMKFLFLPTLLAPLSAATIGSTGMILGGIGSWGDMHIMWFMWWIGDACGILLFTPLFHAWWHHPKKWSTGNRLFEWLVVISFSMLIGWQTFHDRPLAELHGTGTLQFLIMPFLLWAAIRLGLRGVTLVSLISCGWVLWGAADLEHSNERLRQEIEAKVQTESALHKSERRLHKAKEMAEQANESKTRFLAAASHDLRQPLQAIISHTELLAVKNRYPLRT